MSSQSTVTFKVAGNDVISYIDKVKQKTDQMTTDMIANARKQSDAAKEQLKDLEQQIKALERKNKIENEAAKRSTIENRDLKKEQNTAEYNQGIAAIRNDPTLSNTQKRNKGGDLSDTRAAKDDMANKDARDQLMAIREQERQSALQTKLLRDNVEAVKMTSGQEIIQMRKGDDSLIEELDENATPLDQLARNLATEKYKDEQSRKKAEDKEEDKKPESTMSGFLRAMALERGLGLVSQIPNAKNELDFVKPMISMIGMGIGGLMGNLMDAANVKVLGTGLGNTNFGGLGTQIGEKAGEFFGSALERSYKGRDELTTSNFRLQALTGRNLQIDAIGGANGLGGTGMSKVMADLKEYGMDFKETSELQYKIATARGTSAGIGRDSENSVAVEKALGVSQETSQQIMAMRQQYSGDFLKLVGSIAQSGKGNIFAGDRTFLNEFIGKNFMGLQREFLKSGADNAGTASTMDILQRFDKVGGAFAARDPRSMGLISQINNSLVNPTSDAAKAASFLALRQSNPSLGLADLDVERERGLQSPAYLKSMMGYIDQMGGDDQFKRKNISGMLGLSATAAKRLYENRDALLNGTIAQGDLAGVTGEYGESEIRATGQSQTSKYSKSTAEIQNAFVQDVASAVKMVGGKMTDLFGDMIGELKSYITQQFTGTTSAPEQVRKNVVVNKKAAATQKAYADAGFAPMH